MQGGTVFHFRSTAIEEVLAEAVEAARGLDVDLRLGDAERVAILGPNGAGKSTTLAVLAGLLRPDSGRAELDGRLLFDCEGRPTRWRPPHARGIALMAQDGERVMLARSLDRPMRYFLAKATDGPVLIVAERIDEIVAELSRRGWAGQFHPSYTRMVPAHHVTTLRLVGCPDPNPVHRRFFDPPRGTLPEDLDVIGHQYVSALYDELRRHRTEEG